MNFAFIVDKCIQNSFKVDNGKAYKMSDDTPYEWHHSISNECTMGPFAYPFCFNGYLINWPEWNELPDLDLDVIFLVIEKNTDRYSIEDVRKKYPNAEIYATIKELYFYDGYDNRINLFNKADGVVIPYKDSIDRIFPQLRDDVNKKLHFLPQPYDINYLYMKFYRQQRTEQIFSYIPPHPPRRGNTEQFADYLGKKYNVPVVRKATEYSPTQWLDFMKAFSKSTFCVNCDPEPQQGQQGIQSAILGIPNLGGVNDSHYILHPDTATNNLDILEEQFVKMLDVNYRIPIIQESFKKANEIYSFEAVQNTFQTIRENN
jgi:hypothetical protein|tara:strand:- start:1003 stop:1953 length:951 start_codon:yes stop_codon:yes gene_type:complete